MALIFLWNVHVREMGADNPGDAAHALAGKFMTNIFHSNACPETNGSASRVIGRVAKRRETYNSGTSRTMNYDMSSGSNVNSGNSHSYGSSSSGSANGQSSSGFNTGSGHRHGLAVATASARPA